MRILVTVGAPAERAMIVDVARAAGHTVAAVDDLDATWAAFEAAPPHLVVVDADLAHDAAIELCRRVRTAPRGTGSAAFLLALTRRDDGPGLHRVLDAGADDYATKPLSVDRVAASLKIAERRIGDDDARRRAEAALSRAQWLAGIGETSIALQHEINNPLAALLGHVALIEGGLVEPGEEREILAVVAEQAHRIAGVVKRLSALRNPQSVEYLRGGSRMIDLGPDEPAPDAAGPGGGEPDATAG